MPFAASSIRSEWFATCGGHFGDAFFLLLGFYSVGFFYDWNFPSISKEAFEQSLVWSVEEPVGGETPKFTASTPTIVEEVEAIEPIPPKSQSNEKPKKKIPFDS